MYQTLLLMRGVVYAARKHSVVHVPDPSSHERGRVCSKKAFSSYMYQTLLLMRGVVCSKLGHYISFSFPTPRLFGTRFAGHYCVYFDLVLCMRQYCWVACQFGATQRTTNQLKEISFPKTSEHCRCNIACTLQWVSWVQELNFFFGSNK